MENITIESNDDYYRGRLSPTYHTIMGIYLCIVGLASYIGNGVILYVFVRNRLFRQPPINMFIVSLVMGNLGESVFGFPFGAASNLAKRWLFGRIGCNFYGFICYMTTLSNLCTFVAISLYRYIVVCRSEKVSQLLTVKNVRIAIGVVWMYALLWALLPLIGWGSYGPEPYKTTCSLDWTNRSFNSISHIINVFVFVLLLPLLVMVMAYWAILRHTKSQISRAAYESSVEKKSTLPLKHAKHGVTYIKDIETRTSKIVQITILLYVMSWLPYATCSLLSACGVVFPVTVTAIPALIAKTHCAYTPIVYITAHKKFKIALMELIGIRMQQRTVTTPPKHTTPI